MEAGDKWRDDSTLEAAGAELMVVARLLIDGFQVYRTYGNQPGYDALVVDPETKRSIKLQIKSRVAEDSGRFRISHPDFDWAIFVRLNRGTKLDRKEGKRTFAMEPKLYFASKQEVCDLCKVDFSSWTKKLKLRVSVRQLETLGENRDWRLIWNAIDRGDHLK